MKSIFTSLILNNKSRWFLFQIIALVLLLVFFYYISSNAIQNIENRGIHVGFDFLSAEAGFSISESLIDYDESSSYLKAFYVGIVNTLYVGLVAIIFASLLGLIIGIARFSSNWLVRKLASAYIEIFRNIPILLQILFWHNIILINAPSVRESVSFFDAIFFNLRGIYFPKPVDLVSFYLFISTLILSFILLLLLKKSNNNFIKNKLILFKFAIFFVIMLEFFFLDGLYFEFPKLSGFNFEGGFSVSPEFFALAFALSIYTATYIAEAVRSGIGSVSKGQKEAGQALGLNKKQVLKFIVLPQALRVAVPPIISQYLNVIKNSSLAVAIGYPDLVNVFTGTTLNQVGQALEIIAMTMLVYLVISLLISFVLNIVNAKLKIQEK